LVMAGRWLVAPASSFLHYCRATLTKHAVRRNKKMSQVSRFLLVFDNTVDAGND
jgi:hypothetical protein